MKRNQTFDKHHSRLVWEAVIKSLVCGLSVGFAVMFGVGLGTWIAGVNGLWFALAAWAVIGAGATLLFYFKRFKPTAKKDAARLDRLGLEERLTAKVGLLSGGQRQALTLLMATLKKPKLLLLDEHTAALDPKTAKKVLDIIKTYKNENQPKGKNK